MVLGCGYVNSIVSVQRWSRWEARDGGSTLSNLNKILPLFLSSVLKMPFILSSWLFDSRRAYKIGVGGCYQGDKF